MKDRSWKHVYPTQKKRKVRLGTRTFPDREMMRGQGFGVTKGGGGKGGKISVTMEIKWKNCVKGSTKKTGHIKLHEK